MAEGFRELLASDGDILLDLHGRSVRAVEDLLRGKAEWALALCGITHGLYGALRARPGEIGIADDQPIDAGVSILLVGIQSDTGSDLLKVFLVPDERLISRLAYGRIGRGYRCAW